MLRILWISLLACLCADPSRGGEPSKAPPPTDDKARAEALVRQLGDEAFDKREEAEAALRKLDAAALEALRAHRFAADPEVRERVARLLLDLDIAWGEAVNGVRAGISPSRIVLGPQETEIAFRLWHENLGHDTCKICTYAGSNMMSLQLTATKDGKAFSFTPITYAFISQMPGSSDLKPGARQFEDLAFGCNSMPSKGCRLKPGEHCTFKVKNGTIFFRPYAAPALTVIEGKPILELDEVAVLPRNPESGLVTIERAVKDLKTTGSNGDPPAEGKTATTDAIEDGTAIEPEE